MGVLDDAIREHLELKRRHGASDEEISRAEAEALGPARREPPVDPYAVDPAAAEPAQEVDETAIVEPPLAEAPLAEEPLPEEPLAAGEETVVYEEAPGPAAHPPLEDPLGETAEHAPLPPHDDDELAAPAPALPPDPDDSHAENAYGGEPSRPHGDALLGDEPVEADPDEVPAEERLSSPPATEGASEDVLEETPDFLQETPEHDRLWFEQKPPRDFDLDD